MRLRIIPNSHFSAEMNMAIDESIMNFSIKENFSPTLRFYSWEKNCLSLGCNQKISDFNLDLIKETNTALVRRPTGGRAVLHQNEITYSIVLPLSQIPNSNVYDSCKFIHSAIYKAFEKMGIKTKLNLNKKCIPSNPVCFSFPSYSELTFEDKKIVGSAQMRRSGFLMQHGSIPFKSNNNISISIYDFMNEKPDNIDLFEGVYIEGETEHLRQNIIKEISDMLNISNYIANLSDREIETAENLAKNKYGSKEWTFKR